MSSQVWIDTSPAAHLYVAFAHVMANVVTLIIRPTKVGDEKKEREEKGAKREREREKSRDINQKLPPDSAINLVSALPNCLAVATEAGFLSYSFL